MASWYVNRVRQDDAMKRREQRERTSGYDDGLANRPAASTSAIYQASWRRGQEARRDLLLNDLDDAS